MPQIAGRVRFLGALVGAGYGRAALPQQIDCAPVTTLVLRGTAGTAAVNPFAGP